MTAAAANRLGLRCTVLLTTDEGEAPAGNVVLDLLLGPDIQRVGRLSYRDAEAAVAEEAARSTAAGHPAYPIPIGGASPVGAQGYVLGADELAGQAEALAGGLGLVVTADGSGGTHAGLAAGLGGFERVLGVDVGARADLPEALVGMAAAAAELAGRPAPTGVPRVDRDHVGPAYGVATPAGREALDLAARCEGLVLDPVYTGKAMAALVTAARAGTLPGEGTIVYLHTGGLPALFAAGVAEWVRAG
jgi:1-aminocyclopropane-1-carboxylate deaminase/D-cysteine desulfhydrase-like pyridoxal-dependent ACC family enzyme